MSAKTKIVVVKMKHVILTGVLLGILLLLIIFATTKIVALVDKV